MQHGPIDLIIKAEGEAAAIHAAYQLAAERFQSVLTELVSELPQLRQTVNKISKPRTPVAQRMWRATKNFSNYFITPMGAVAGSVADEILQVMIKDTNGLRKVFVNNGGDIAMWKNEDEEFSIVLVPQLVLQRYSNKKQITVRIGPADDIGGVATSGWQGRSHSLGIADSVTVLAENAAIADASATLIANAVDINSETVCRQPASEMEMDSDLGEQLITVDVSPLNMNECHSALINGLKQATEFLNSHFLKSAFLFLQDQYVTVPGMELSTNSASKNLKTH